MDQNTLTEKELTEQATEAGKEYASKYGQIAGGHVTATCVFADGYIAGYSASHPPSPAQPPVNGELLGFLEIEIEKANKNGKACNLKDGDLNRARAWYAAAEAFSIVKNKITELLNTPHGHESNIINCPSCNTVWDLSRHNSCQCGATLATKASPAKAEQEGPPNWSNKANYSGDSYIGGYHWFHTLMGKVRDIGIYMQQHEVDSILRSTWGQQIRDIYSDMSEWFAYIYERESGKQVYREQEGLRWVKANKEGMNRSRIFRDANLPENNIHQWPIKGWDEKGVKFKGNFDSNVIMEWWELEWLESTTPPVKEVAYDELWDEFSEYIDDDIDSLSIFAGRTVLTEAQYNKLVAKLKAAPVNEAGQPRNLSIEELIKLSDEELNVEINKVRSRLGMGKSEEAGRSTDEDQYELYKAGYANGHRDGKREVSRLQPAPSGFRWVPITQWGKVKRDITKVLVKYDTGEIRRFSEDDQPANLQTHFMDLSDSPAPVQVNLVAFANWIGEQAYYLDQISRNWAWEGCIPGQEITTECLLEKYIQSLQNNKP